MKKLLFLVFTMVMTLGLGNASADNKKDLKGVTTTIFTTNLHCEGCVKKVMNNIPFKKGVKDVKVDIKSKDITVSYDSKKSSDAKIIEYFDKIDITAKVKKAAKK